MIQSGTIVKIVDKTGAILGRVIKVLGSNRVHRIANVGDIVLLSVRWHNIKYTVKHKQNNKRKERFRIGTLHRGLVVRTRVNTAIATGGWVRYNESAVCIVNKKGIPVSKRCIGPVSRELCMKYPALGCISRTII